MYTRSKQKVSLIISILLLLSQSAVYSRNRAEDWRDAENLRQKGVAHRIGLAVAPRDIPETDSHQSHQEQMVSALNRTPESQDGSFLLDRAEALLEEGAIRESLILFQSVIRMDLHSGSSDISLRDAAVRSRDRVKQLRFASERVRQLDDSIGVIPLYINQSDQTVLSDPDISLAVSLPGRWRFAYGLREGEGSRQVVYAGQGDLVFTLEKVKIDTNQTLSPEELLLMEDIRRSLSRQRKLTLNFERVGAPGIVNPPSGVSASTRCGLFRVSLDHNKGRVQYGEFACVNGVHGVRLELRRNSDGALPMETLKKIADTVQFVTEDSLSPDTNP